MAYLVESQPSKNFAAAMKELKKLSNISQLNLQIFYFYQLKNNGIDIEINVYRYLKP